VSSLIMTSIVKLSIIMLRVIMLIVIMLCIVVPFNFRRYNTQHNGPSYDALHRQSA
jgi:hypothetical protein